MSTESSFSPPKKPPRPSRIEGGPSEEEIRAEFAAQLEKFFRETNPSKLDYSPDTETSFLDFIQEQYHGEEVALVSDLAKKYGDVSTRELAALGLKLQKASRTTVK